MPRPSTRCELCGAAAYLPFRCALALALLFAALGCGAPGLSPSRLPHDVLASSRTNRRQLNIAGVATPGIADSQIAAGDLLEVTLASGREGEGLKPTLARVADDGAVDVPLVGAVPVAGLEATAAEQAIARASIDRGIYRRPHVAVEIKTKAVNRVTVLGAVGEPGVHEVSRTNSNLVAALAAAGGLTDEAGTVVEIVRQPALSNLAANDAAGGVQQASYQSDARPNAAPAPPQTQRIDLANPAAAQGSALGDRDVVVVKPRDKEMIYVAGLVKKPGQFEMPVDRDVRLLDAIAMAGGLDSPVADRVLVVRNVPGRPEPIPIRCSVSAAKRVGSENLVLAAGDAVSIEQTPATAVVDTFRQLFRMSLGVSRSGSIF